MLSHPWPFPQAALTVTELTKGTQLQYKAHLKLPHGPCSYTNMKGRRVPGVGVRVELGDHDQFHSSLFPGEEDILLVITDAQIHLSSPMMCWAP